MARSIADVERRTIKQLMVADLAKSGLVPHARRLAVRALEAPEVKRLWSGFYEAGAMRIPYWTLDGRQTKFFRIRYLEKLPGAAGIIEKPQRYDQMPVLQEAYYPPLLKTPWDVIAKDPSIGVAITEGEKKAACACAHKIPMMALGGVYSFMSSKKSVDLLPSMREIVWKERHVYVVYDNDLVNNPDVLRAQHMLSQRLLAEGAKIKYISIPKGPQKGVDDFIVKWGAQAFVDLIDKAEPFLEGDALWKLSSEVVYIRSIDAVVERDGHVVMDTDKFVRHIYANRHYMAQVEKGSGKNRYVVLEKQPLAKRWVEWEQRAELQELCYEPGRERVVDGRAWNMWNGFGVHPKKGPLGPWHDLLDFLFHRADRERKYFEQWCAYPIIHPGAKLFVACVLWSRIKRVGKSIIAQALKQIYGENAGFVQSKQLKREFNTWARNKQLVIGEEITVGKDQIDADYLKYIITHPFFTIHAKFKDEYDIANHTQFLLLSNHPDAVMLEDGDKRYMIHGISRTERDRDAYKKSGKYAAFGKWLCGDGPAHLMYYFLHDVNMRGFNPHDHAPETTSKYEMIQVGKNNVSLWVQRLYEDPGRALKPLGDRIAEGCDLYPSELLYRAFDPGDRSHNSQSGPASLGKALHSHGFRLVNQTIPVMTSTGLHRLYAIRNVVKWEQATRKEIRAHYDEFHSPKTMGGVK